MVCWPRAAVLASLGLVALTGCSGPADETAGPVEPGNGDRPPNVVLIVVDTLRHDHLGVYGYERDTAPQLTRRLARRGVVVEEAYVQAPWTLPSMASMLTGLPPADLLDVDGHPWGIPGEAVTLAEALKARGYRTAAFVANPTLHEGNGFAQGFDVFHTAPYDVASMARHADDVNARVLPWLASAPPEPFFLYLHYLDPHDPYDNPDLVDGRSPFYPDYDGTLRGTDVHGLYLGSVEMTDPERDVAHLEALYDSEIRYVDRHLGEVLDAVGGEVLGRSLVVLTSDHGEELFDHGGWKHGETLYEELIHVPLVVRWDGRLPAGERLAGTVRLLDLVPTVLAAAGAPPRPELPGVDLLPALAGGGLDERPAFARHFSAGPLRAARIEDRRKEILFDRHAPFAPADEREATLWRRDVERMSRHEVYDLEADPRERHDLAVGGGEAWRVAARVDPWLEGLRIVASDLPAGSRLRGEVALDVGGGGAWSVRPLFLGPRDAHRVEDGVLRFELAGDGLDKGFVVTGPLRAVTGIEARLDGVVLEPRLAGRARGGSVDTAAPLSLRDLLVDAYPPAAARGEPALHLWTRQPRRPLTPGERDDETLQRLRALGYAQ